MPKKEKDVIILLSIILEVKIVMGEIIVYAEPAANAAAQNANAGLFGNFGMFIPLIAMLLIFWLLLVRPQKKKEKELKNMLAALKVGDEVATIGGIHGKITKIKDDLFVLETGSGVNKSYVTVDRSAVSRFLKQAEENKTPTPIPGEEETEETTEE